MSPTEKIARMIATGYSAVTISIRRDIAHSMSLVKKSAASPNSDSDRIAWNELLSMIDNRCDSNTCGHLWPELKLPSSVLKWGDDASVRDALATSRLLKLAFRLIDARPNSRGSKKKSKKRSATNKACAKLSARETLDLVDDIVARIDVAENQPVAKIEVLAFAYALPELAVSLREDQWWRLFSALIDLRDHVIDEFHEGTTQRLILGGELGLALAYRLPKLAACEPLAASSWDALLDWLMAEEQRLGDTLSNGGGQLRMALASAMRVQRLGAAVLKRSLKRDHEAELNEMATWAALLLRHDGSTAFGNTASSATSELLNQTADSLSDDGLRNADGFARRKLKKPTVGRLRVEAELPEAGLFNESGRITVMRPSWFEHHGVAKADFSEIEGTRVEITTAKTMLFAGQWSAEIKVNGQAAVGQSQWEEVCWYSDDDVHYLEMEQHWSQGVTLQRQIMLVREDGAMLLADSVFCETDAEIAYEGALPMADGLRATPEEETREITISDSKPRALVMPIGLPEWQVGFSNGKMQVDSHIRLSQTGTARLYAPLWIDLQRRRYSRPRTWRNLAVYSDLEPSPPNDAVASRVQLGSEQWLVFRALGAPASWTFCGKHVAADFYCARFDPEDGNCDELVTVENYAG